MQTRLPLAIIEDQTPIREMLHQYLCAQPEFECVLTAVSMEDFFQQLPTLGTAPVLVLSDIGLPGRSGIEGLPLILDWLPAAQVLMLSVYTDAARVFEAICAGAVGYLVKNTPLPDIKAHLLEVAAGGSPMSPAVARHVLQAFRRQPPVAVAATAGARLTPREQEIVTAGSWCPSTSWCSRAPACPARPSACWPTRPAPCGWACARGCMPSCPPPASCARYRCLRP